MSIAVAFQQHKLALPQHNLAEGATNPARLSYGIELCIFGLDVRFFINKVCLQNMRPKRQNMYFHNLGFDKKYYRGYNLYRG